MTQDSRNTSTTDRQARIRAAKTKRALFKIVMLVAILAIAGVFAKMAKDKWDHQDAPDFLADLDQKDPIRRDPHFEPGSVNLAALQPDRTTAATGAPANTTPEPGRPTPPKNYTDDPWAKEMLARAGDLYKGLQFAPAAEVLAPASQKAISPDLAKQLADLRRRCEQFPRAIAHIAPLPLAQDANPNQLWDVTIGQGEYIFNIAKGRESGALYGEAILRRTPVSAGSMKLSFDPNDGNVLAKKISRADLLQEFRTYFKNVEQQSGLIAEPNTCYDLVFLARKMCLEPETLQYLETADKMCQAAGAQIDNVFRDRCIALALDRAVFYDNLNQRKPAERILAEMVETLKGYERAQKEADDLKNMWKRFEGKKTVSTVRLVKDAAAQTAAAPAGNDGGEEDGELGVGEITVTGQDGSTAKVDPKKKTETAPVGIAAASAARGNEDIAFDDIGAGNNAKASDKIAQADKLFREGIEHMRKGKNMTGGADNQAELHSAAEKLNRAADLYQEAADANKATNAGLSSSLATRAVESGQYAYGCEKAQALDFYSTYKNKRR